MPTFAEVTKGASKRTLSEENNEFMINYQKRYLLFIYLFYELKLTSVVHYEVSA